MNRLHSLSEEELKKLLSHYGLMASTTSTHSTPKTRTAKASPKRKKAEADVQPIDLNGNPHFGQSQGVNKDQAMYGLRNLFSTVMKPTKSPAETFRELTEEEIENEELNHKNAMVGTLLELSAGVLAIIAVLALVPNVFDFVTSQFTNASTRVVCWIILALFGVGMYFVLRTLTIINYEYANLMDVFKKSRGYSLDSKKKIPFYELLPRAQYGIVFDKMDAVFRVAKDGGRVYHDSMADILMTKNITQDEIPNFLANSMTMIGLIGTIIGLTGATGGMEELFTSIGDIQSLKDGFTTTLTGINVAFFTTLFGAVGMLTLKYFNIVARKARAVFLSELEQVVLTEVLPKIPRIDFVEETVKTTKTVKKTTRRRVTKK